MGDDERKVIGVTHSGRTEEIELDESKQLSIYEFVLETLAWENGGSMVITHDRWERARDAARAHNKGKVTAVITAFTKDYITVTLVDDETQRPIAGGEQ